MEQSMGPVMCDPRSLIEGLNPQQEEAVKYYGQALLIGAGAGSGKTRVLTRRIAWLLAHGFWASSILAITFTNKAAAEMRERLVTLVGPEAEHMWISTFHSACVRILRRDGKEIGLKSGFSIYDTADSERLVKLIAADLNIDTKRYTPRMLLGKISDCKNALVSWKDQLKKANCDYIPGQRGYQVSAGDVDELVAVVYAEYQHRLALANAVDFDDLIMRTVELLQTCPQVSEYYRHRFRYIFVDEYQDTNHAQYVLVRELSGIDSDEQPDPQARGAGRVGPSWITVVGDSDQSIYAFRGADIRNIQDFEQDFPNAKTIMLEQNYRSTQTILDAANAVIQNNQGRKGKTLWTDNGGGDVVTVKTTFNESDEANYVAGDILMGVNRGRNFRDTAVLYRMNAQSNALEYAMKRNGIPYKVVGGMKFFDRAEVKDMLAYLCVLNNPLDDLRLRRIINNPPRGIGATTLDKVGALAESQGASLYEIIRNADLFPELKASSAKLLKFADLIDGLRRAGTELALPEFYDAVCDQTGYVKALEEKNDMESRGRIENVQELKSNILGFLEQQPEDATLSGFLNEIALYTDLDSVEASDDCVTMMTIHSAKGLEFPVVYVVGMEEGIFPGASAQYDQEELEEERRLCYVAMTRAKEKLTLTNCRQRMLYGRTSANRASRFLEEIPEENMRWESKPEPRFGGMEHDGTFGGDRYEDGWGSSPARAGGAWSSGGVHSYRAPAQAPQRPLASVQQASSTRKNAAPAAPLLQLQQGDMVEHTAFGKGMVLSVRPMGGDALAEVAFDTVGKKKLMLKSAGAHMRKL